MDIKSIVNSLIKKYKTNNPFELCDYLNIDILYLPLGEMRGFYRYKKRNKIITVNSDLDDRDKLQTCSHELGHAILHTKLNAIFLTHHTAFSKNKFEVEANKFSAELIVPDDLLNRMEYEGFNLEQIAIAENVHIELLKLKFNKFN